MEHLVSSLTSPSAAVAFVSTAAISVAPNVVLLIFPNIQEGQQYSGWLSLGQSMAAGGLLGDVFLHTIAEGDANSGIWILAGFVIFFAADLVVRVLQEEVVGDNDIFVDDRKKVNDHNGVTNIASEDKRSEPETRRSTIILNIAADALHNFTDGLAIGSTYAGSTGSTFSAVLSNHTRGGTATLSIMCHEIPHEIGDYCTLIRSGYSRTQAILMQLCTALAAFAGTAVALYSQLWAEKKLIWITAGGFIYLAASTLLPEVLQETSARGSQSIVFRFAQFASFLVGIVFLYAVAVLEEYDFQDSSAHHQGHHHNHGYHAHSSEL